VSRRPGGGSRFQPEGVSGLLPLFVESRNAIRGKGSGLEVDQAICTVVTVREGKIAAIWDFTDRQAALESAGLRE
jgi:hypothetical protein